jgi:GNAT superfamily N-acetyltransferase
MEIRVLKEFELEIIQNLAYQIWPVTYQSILSEEQMKYMLNWMYSIETLIKSFHSGHTFFCISNNHSDIGFLDVEINHPQKANLKIHKIYVLPEFHGKGVGYQLLKEAKRFALSNEMNSISLQVNRNNNALNFYLRNDFKIIDEQDFDIGGGYFMNDYVMKLNFD